MNCHNCKSKADWVVQSVNLSYWYCKTCKVEPIDLPILEEPTPAPRSWETGTISQAWSPLILPKHVAVNPYSLQCSNCDKDIYSTNPCTPTVK